MKIYTIARIIGEDVLPLPLKPMTKREARLYRIHLKRVMKFTGTFVLYNPNAV